MSIFIGGTGSANELDDYEEGNWSPAIYQGGFTISSTNQAKYIKIGSQVTIWCYISLSGTPNTDQFLMSGLPFTILSNNYATGPLDAGKGGVKGAFVRVEGHTNDRVGFYYPSENTSNSRVPVAANEIGTNNYLIFSVTYQTST